MPCKKKLLPFPDTILRKEKSRQRKGRKKEEIKNSNKGVCVCAWVRGVDLDALITMSFIITAFKVVRQRQTVFVRKEKERDWVCI